MRLFLSLLLSVILALSCSVCLCADVEEIPDDLPSVGDELGAIVSGLPDISSAFTPPKTTQQEAEGADTPERALAPSSDLDDDYGIMPLDSTYGGAWSGSVYDFFSGVMCGHPFKDYVCFRQSQYEYHLYFGTDISLSGNNFVGSDLTHIIYNTGNGYNSNEYFSTATGSSLTYYVDGIFYSNVGDFSSRFKEVTLIEYILIASIVLGIMLCIIFVRGFFKS